MRTKPRLFGRSKAVHAAKWRHRAMSQDSRAQQGAAQMSSTATTILSRSNCWLGRVRHRWPELRQQAPRLLRRAPPKEAPTISRFFAAPLPLRSPGRELQDLLPKVMVASARHWARSCCHVTPGGDNCSPAFQRARPRITESNESALQISSLFSAFISWSFGSLVRSFATSFTSVGTRTPGRF